ncbi:MAG TPA: zinc ABC transporter substrate-binding protein [Candidatus Obscuribacterales bacterium]
MPLGGKGKGRSLGIAGGAIAILLSGCEPRPQVSGATPTDAINVVATSTLIADWAAQVGGDDIELVSILTPGADPHIYEPVPQDSVALEEADLIFYNGYNLEPNLIRLAASVGGEARQVALAEVVTPLAVADPAQQVPDPHVWGDVANVVPMVALMEAELSQLAPEQSAAFAAQAAAFIAQLEQLDGWIQTQIATIPPAQRKLVTTHDAFQYYAAAYGLEVTGTLIGISTEEQPSAQTVRTLADTLRDLGVPAIFAETTINPRLITTVAAEAEVQLAPTALYSDSIGAPGSEADTYIKMMVANTRAIVENLGGEYTPFTPE